MIKINLLSQVRAKKIKKRAEIQYQLWLFGGSLVILVVCLGYGWFYLNDRVKTLEAEKQEKDQRLAVLREKVKEVENIERDKRNFEEKIRIIKQLKANQSGPVHLLDQISRNKPDRIWLVSMSQKGKSVTIGGKALTNSELVDFIDALKTSGFFSNIELHESRQEVQDGVPIFNFSLTCTMKI